MPSDNIDAIANSVGMRVIDDLAMESTLSFGHQRLFVSGLRSSVTMLFGEPDNYFGGLNISAEDPYAYDERDIGIVREVADLIDVCFRQTRLLSETRCYAAQLEQRVQERTSALSVMNAELLQANQLKDNFLAGISHELRTPLNAVLANATLLLDGVYGPLQQRQSHAIEVVEGSGRHLLNLIDDILDLAKIEAGKVELSQSVFDVTELVYSSIDIVHPIALEKNIDISSNVCPEDVQLEADMRRMRQILVNLLGNAVKFTPARGKVGVNVDGDMESQTICISVWDTGIGMSSEYMDSHLFKAFEQMNTLVNRCDYAIS